MKESNKFYFISGLKGFVPIKPARRYCGWTERVLRIANYSNG